MNMMPTPRRTAPDSPSRQLLYELNQLFISDQSELLERLDRENAAREKIHREAINAAAAAHEKVRLSVELERRRLEEQVKAEREHRDAEARREIEQLQRERAAREAEEKRLEVERAKEREEEKKRLADLERQHREVNEAARLREQKEKEQSDQRRREQQAVQQQQQRPQTSLSQAPPHPPQASTTPASTTPLRPPPISTATPQAVATLPTSSATPQSNGLPRDSSLENEHKEYLEIHKRLKDLRNTMTVEAKKIPALKESVGDMRRQIRKCVGQLTHSKTQKGVNNQSINTLITTFKTSLTVQSPIIPISPFLPSSQSSTNTTAPSLLLYLLNIFSKALISQWIDEAGVNTDAADPVGVVASTIFANPAFQPNGAPLISILLAKYHKTCPILFGIYGPENTVQGKQRLAWWRNESGGYVTQQQHFQRMTGLSAGYASLSLRNYSKSKVSRNPYPDYQYWATVARLANTPANQLTQTHFVVIKGLVDKYEERFIGFYGNAAIAVLKVLLVDLPNRLPEEMRKNSAVMGIVALAETETKDNGLIL